jgi:hypothetical protein
MTRSRFSGEQIAYALREAESGTAEVVQLDHVRNCGAHHVK